MIARLLWLLAVCLIIAGLGWAHQALAEQRTIYGKDGVAIGRVDTDSQGTTTLYGRDGRVIDRAARNQGGTIIYDGLSGNIVGKEPRPAPSLQDKRRGH